MHGSRLTTLTEGSCGKGNTSALIDLTLYGHYVTVFIIVFNRTLGIIGSEEFDLHHLFSHELAPILTSLLLDDGSIISASSK